MTLEHNTTYAVVNMTNLPSYRNTDNTINIAYTNNEGAVDTAIGEKK